MGQPVDADANGVGLAGPAIGVQSRGRIERRRLLSDQRTLAPGEIEPARSRRRMQQVTGGRRGGEGSGAHRAPNRRPPNRRRLSTMKDRGARVVGSVARVGADGCLQRDGALHRRLLDAHRLADRLAVVERRRAADLRGAPAEAGGGHGSQADEEGHRPLAVEGEPAVYGTAHHPVGGMPPPASGGRNTSLTCGSGAPQPTRWRSAHWYGGASAATQPARSRSM